MSLRRNDGFVIQEKRVIIGLRLICFMGTIVLCVLPMSNLTGLLPSMGVLRSCNKADYASSLLSLAFQKYFLQFENSCFSAKTLKSSAINCGPLLHYYIITVSSMPYLSKNDFAHLKISAIIICYNQMFLFAPLKRVSAHLLPRSLG